MDLKDQRLGFLDAAKKIANEAKGAGRGLTKNEIGTVDSLMAKVDDLDASLKQIAETDALLVKIGANRTADPNNDPVPPYEGYTAGPGPGDGLGLALTGRHAKSLAGRLASKMNHKSLVDSGTVVDSPLARDVVPEGQLVQSILQLLPVVIKQQGSSWRYLRQTVRTNAAAIVAAGDAKPESVYSVKEITNDLQVFAHISEAIDKYVVLDSPSLTRFIGMELTYGLGQAVESEVITGDGTAGHLTGLLHTSGTKSVGYGTDPISTLRDAITTLEIEGFVGRAFVLNPKDWRDIETSRNLSGAFDLDGPVDRAARRAWGVPVTVSTALTEGTALAVDTSALAVASDGAVALEWSSAVDDDFQRNQARVRCESRYALDVYQPAGVAVIDLDDSSSSA